jgi:hypothetical protein
MFRSQLFDHLQGVPSFVLSSVTTSLLVCVVKLFIWYVVVCLCVCVSDVHQTRKQTIRVVVTALSTKDGLLKMVKQL